MLPETALARHRTIGDHAGCPRIALRERQFLGHFGAGPKEDLVRCLPTERWMRHLRVVLVDVKFDHRTNTRHKIQGIQEQPLMLQRTPIGLDERIGEADLDLGKSMRSKHALNKVAFTALLTFSMPESAYSNGRSAITRCLPAASNT